MAPDTIIETVDVTKVYGMGEVKVAALDGVSIRIQSGEFTAIMGPSGSGKSTLMHIFGCLSQPTQGRYILAGEDVSHLDKMELAAIRNNKLGFVFQTYNLLPRASALENVRLPLIYDRVTQRTHGEQETRSREVLEAVGLSDRAHHLPQELSGGEQQRVAIARALINDPLLILADEPTGNLDSQSGLEIMQLLHQLHQQGRTIVMVTHDAEIAAHTQRTIHLLDGRVERIQDNGTRARGRKKASDESR